MTVTNKTTRKTIQELLIEQAENLVPVDGDKAFTLYHGLIWEGVLKEVPWDSEQGWGGWVIVPAGGKQVFSHREGYYKYFEGMVAANVKVYHPNDYNLESDEEDDYDHEKFGMSEGTKRVRFDTKRSMFYLRAEED